MYYTLLLKMEIISFFHKRSMHLKRTYILRRLGKLQYLIPVHFLEAFQVHCRHFAIVPHSCLFPKNRTEYINSNNHSLSMKQVNLVPWGSSRQKLGLLSVIHAEHSKQPLAVQPPVSDHHKCKYLVEVAYGRWSLTRIEPQISFYR